MKQRFNEDTIVAVSTPVGESGIGIVRLSGKDAVRISDKVFMPPDKKKPSKFKTHTIRYGYIFGQKKEIIDEVLLTVMKAPKTYTKEDVVEINCHGGMVALRKVTELVLPGLILPAASVDIVCEAMKISVLQPVSQATM